MYCNWICQRCGMEKSLNVSMEKTIFMSQYMRRPKEGFRVAVCCGPCIWSLNTSETDPHSYEANKGQKKFNVGASKVFLGFICNCLSYFITLEISFTSILYLQFTHMIFIIYTSCPRSMMPCSVYIYDGT